MSSDNAKFRNRLEQCRQAGRHDVLLWDDEWEVILKVKDRSKITDPLSTQDMVSGYGNPNDCNKNVEVELQKLLTISTDLQMNKPSCREMLLNGLEDQETIFRAANPNFPSVDMPPDIRKIVSFATSHEKLGSLIQEIELLATSPKTKRALSDLLGDYKKCKEMHESVKGSWTDKNRLNSDEI